MASVNFMSRAILLGIINCGMISRKVQRTTVILSIIRHGVQSIFLV
jgi:hypothetical protein